MYQDPARNVLSLKAPVPKDDGEDNMSRLFAAIVTYWQLGDDPAQYRTRLPAFMTNRVSLDPKYQAYYALAKRVIDGLIADKGEAAAYVFLFTSKPRAKPIAPTTELEFVQYYVANEFIAYRLALGGFAASGLSIIVASLEEPIFRAGLLPTGLEKLGERRNGGR